jgi:hypothetical protein
MWKLLKVLLNIQDKKPPAPKMPKVELHGFDLDEWHYLGNSEISYNVPENGKTTQYHARLFFFMNKENENIRDFVLKTNMPHLNFENHAWVTTNAHMWKACEKEYFFPINIEPSKYLRERMKIENGYFWDEKERWWSKNDNAKYNLAAEKQKKTKKIVQTVSEDEDDNKVIKLDFSKKED